MKEALLGGPVPARGALRVILAVVVMAVAAAGWTVEYRGSFHPTISFFPDTFDYAQMGRQVQRGEGFTSLQTFPYVLDYLADHGVSTDPPWPNVTRFPLIAVFEAISFSIVGANELGIVLVGGAFLVGTALIVFLLGNRLFGPLVGFVAALLGCCNPTQLRFALSGLLEPGAAFFLVASALALAVVVSDAQRRLGPPFWLGLLLGLAFLLRYDLLVLAPVTGLLLLLGPGRRDAKALAVCGLGFLVVSGPWFARNLTLFGSFLGSTSVDRNILGRVVEGDVYQSFERPNTFSILLQNYRAVLGKLLAGPVWIAEHAGDLLGRGFVWSGPLFFVSVVLASSPVVRLVWLFTLGAFVSRVILLSIMHHEVRFYTSFAPLVLVFAVGAGAALLRALPSLLHPILPLAAAVAVFSAISPFWAKIGGPGPGLRGNREVFDFVREHTAPGTVIVAPPSALVAWYSDRPAVRFSGGKVVAQLDERSVRVGALLLRSGAPAYTRQLLEAAAPVRFRKAGESGNFALWLREDSAPGGGAP